MVKVRWRASSLILFGAVFIHLPYIVSPTERKPIGEITQVSSRAGMVGIRSSKAIPQQPCEAVLLFAVLHLVARVAMVLLA
jgi:hypothetical protein